MPPKSSKRATISRLKKQIKQAIKSGQPDYAARLQTKLDEYQKRE
jgi:hypothetical protein